MQTFLPFSQFDRSAQVLDRQRLGKQRVEVKQLLNSTWLVENGRSGGWTSHPATQMWVGCRDLLTRYGIVICDEWARRGYVDNIGKELRELLNMGLSKGVPTWLGDERLHSSHRARLLDKEPDWYGQFGWTEEPCGPEGYWWPTKHAV